MNHDIYVCDKAGSLLDFSGKVITTGADYRLRYEYTGQGDNSFSPTEVCTDHIGYVLITESQKPPNSHPGPGGTFYTVCPDLTTGTEVAIHH